MEISPCFLLLACVAHHCALAFDPPSSTDTSLYACNETALLDASAAFFALEQCATAAASGDAACLAAHNVSAGAACVCAACGSFTSAVLLQYAALLDAGQCAVQLQNVSATERLRELFVYQYPCLLRDASIESCEQPGNFLCGQPSRWRNAKVIKH